MTELSNGRPVRISGTLFHIPRKDRSQFKDYFAALLGVNASRSSSILVAPPSVLRDAIKKVERRFDAISNQDVKNRCWQIVNKLFSYTKFYEGKGWRLMADKHLAGESLPSWGVAQFIKMLGVRYCPYCNSDPVYAVDVRRPRSEGASNKPRVNGKIAKSALDHYYSQKDYPYLAISLGNLVPSCTRCNTSMKGDFEFTGRRYAHPYEDKVHESFRFRCDEQENGAFVITSAPAQTAEERRARRLVEFFQVDKVYTALYQTEIADLITRRKKFGRHYVREFLGKILIGHSQDEINRLVYGYSFNPGEINKERLGKLMIDVSGIDSLRREVQGVHTD